MTAPDIESTLTAAFAERHARQEAHRPSLADVHRRARHRRSRRAAVRAGAVVGAGAAVLAGVAWTTSRRDDPPASRALPADGSADGPLGVAGPVSTVLSAEGLWAAVAAHLGVSVEELQAANPAVDFTDAPVPGTELAVPGPVPFDPRVPASTTPAPTMTAPMTLPPPVATITVLGGPEPTSGAPTTVSATLPPQPRSTVTLPGGSQPVLGAPTTTVIVGPDGAACALDDAQAQAVADVARAPLSPGDTLPVTFPAAGLPAGCGSVPSVPPGWTLYVVAAGDYVAGIANRFCTTTEEIVAGNGWPDLNVPIFPESFIAVPADAC